MWVHQCTFLITIQMSIYVQVSMLINKMLNYIYYAYKASNGLILNLYWIVYWKILNFDFLSWNGLVIKFFHTKLLHSFQPPDCGQYHSQALEMVIHYLCLNTVLSINHGQSNCVLSISRNANIFINGGLLIINVLTWQSVPFKPHYYF
jgi:hypothetical protein